eukprot:g2801.t1
MPTTDWMMSKRSFCISPEEVADALHSCMEWNMDSYLLSLLTPAAQSARPPISEFYVAAAGLGKSGAVYIGVNLEFPGVPLYNTVHAEQFLVQNALFHGETEFQCIALTDFPCGHCRQFLSELHNSEVLRFIFLNSSVKEALLPEILPLRFKPQAVLGSEIGDLLMAYNGKQKVEFNQTAKDKIAKLSGDPLFVKAAEEAKDHAARSYVPYSGCLSAVAILTNAGHVFAGSCIENVAYNPTLPPLQAAIINAISAMKLESYNEIKTAVLVECEGRQNVNQAAATSVILKTIAPMAELVVLHIQRIEILMKRSIRFLNTLRSWFSTEIVPYEAATIAERTLDHRAWFKESGFSEEDYNTLITRYPRLNEVHLDEPITAKLSFLSEKGMNQQGVVRFFDHVLKQFPEFLEFSLENDIEPNFTYLSSLGFSDNRILIMMIKFPQLLSYDIQSSYSTKIAFLEKLGFTRGEVLDLIFHFPQIVEVSLTNNIDPLVTYLLQELDFESHEVCKIIRKSPELLGVRLSAVRVKLEYLIDSGYELKCVKSLLKRFPVFLRGSLNRDIQPILELLMEYSSIKTVQKIFHKCPQLLCRSYELDIHPKFHFFVELGYDPVDLRILLEQFPEFRNRLKLD